MRKFITMDGGSVEFTEVSESYDVHTRNAAGESIATVIMRKDEAENYMRWLAAAR